LTHKEIVAELLENYEKLDDEIKLEIPLKKIWIVNNNEE
jgi:restriction system protein